MVRVRGKGMNYLNECHHKDRNTKMCVCVCVFDVYMVSIGHMEVDESVFHFRKTSCTPYISLAK